MNRVCPHCGASLPEEAAFCPHCAKSVNQRAEYHPPSPLFGKILRASGVLLAAVVIVLAVWWFNRPQTLDGQAEVIYTDEDGTYQLVLGYPQDRYQPIPETRHEVQEGEDYRFPSRLYINHKDSGADAGGLFLKKVDHVTVDFLQPADSPSPWVDSDPAPHDTAPDAALVSLIDFTAQSGDTELIWTLSMKNGDTIRLHQKIFVTVIPTLDYYPTDAPMNTTEELQALIDEITKTADPTAIVNLHLPPVTYTGSLMLEGRSINLTGSEEGRTVFTGHIQVTAKETQPICYFDNLDFVGDGTGVGISAATRLHLTNCTIAGWKTGVLAYGYTWVSAMYCRFENNEIGFQFNADGVSVSHTLYTGNQFVNNSTAVLLESVPTDVSMKFGECVFSGNSTDIDNRCNQAIDISEATFE